MFSVPVQTSAFLISKSSSAVSNSDTISSLLRREERALVFFQVRLCDFKDRWKNPFHSAFTTLKLKTHFVELLNHLLSDMALFCGLSSTNTLDIIDELVTLNVFTSASGILLKENLYHLYKIRLRLHLLYGQQNEEAFVPGNLSPYVLTPEEYNQLERIYHLILVPFYATLPQILTIQKLPSNLDLPHTAFVEALVNSRLSEPFLRHFVQNLLATAASDTFHQQHYTSLSKSSVTESLRDTYLKVLKSSPVHQTLLATLASIPTLAGLRDAFRRSQESPEVQLLAITTPFLTTNPEVAVTAPSWTRPRYLKAEIIQQALDPSGHLKKSYPHSAHNVCRVQGSCNASPNRASSSSASSANAGTAGAGYDLHLKQKPSHPLMEYVPSTPSPAASPEK